MALVVEDGTGLTNAESFISVANADARHTALGNTAWTGADAVKEAALRKATNYMEGAYRQAWKGTKWTRTQALSWPRFNAYVDGWLIDGNIVPAEVANACADLALKALSEELAPDLERAVIREKIGPIETEYSASLPQSKRFRAIDMMLGPYLKAGGSSARLVRA